MRAVFLSDSILPNIVFMHFEESQVFIVQIDLGRAAHMVAEI